MHLGYVIIMGDFEKCVGTSQDATFDAHFAGVRHQDLLKQAIALE